MKSRCRRVIIGIVLHFAYYNPGTNLLILIHILFTNNIDIKNGCRGLHHSEIEKSSTHEFELAGQQMTELSWTQV